MKQRLKFFQLTVQVANDVVVQIFIPSLFRATKYNAVRCMMQLSFCNRYDNHFQAIPDAVYPAGVMHLFRRE